jgi:hypothetical protein
MASRRRVRGILVVLQTANVNISRVVTPLGGGSCIALAVLLAVDRAKGNHLLDSDETDGDAPRSRRDPG